MLANNLFFLSKQVLTSRIEGRYKRVRTNAESKAPMKEYVCEPCHKYENLKTLALYSIVITIKIVPLQKQKSRKEHLMSSMRSECSWMKV